MKIGVLTICLLSLALAFQLACSQTNSASEKTNDTSSTNSNANESSGNAPTKILDAAAQRNNLKAQAIEASQTIQNRDFAKLADYTHPRVFENRTGGREQMIRESRDAIEQLENENFKITLVEVGDPGEIVAVQTQLFAIVPLNAVISAPKTKMKQSTSIVGISDDNGVNWKFVNGVNQEKFKELFPNAADKIKIPQDSLQSVKEK